MRNLKDKLFSFIKMKLYNKTPEDGTNNFIFLKLKIYLMKLFLQKNK